MRPSHSCVGKAIVIMSCADTSSTELIDPPSAHGWPEHGNCCTWAMTLAPPSTGPMAGMSPLPDPFQSRPMTTTIHLSGPADVLTVLPYQLGFHPHRCLVVVSLHGTRMGLVQRIDLPPPDHVGDAVAAMITPLRQDNPNAVLLIGFEERQGESRAMLDQMGDA